MGEGEAVAAAAGLGVAVVIDGLRPPALPLSSPLATFAGAWEDDPPPSVLPLLRAIARAGWAHPTPIQAVAIPALVAGWDVLALAPTGSGKTVAYGLPAILHAVAHADSPHPRPHSGAGLERDRGLPSPTALILLPTRELAVQVGGVLRTLAGGAGTTSVLLIGGAGKYEQSVELRRAGGPGCVVATPGRLMEHVRDASLSLARTSFLVLDEADRLLDMGFEGQVRAVASSLRPDVRVALVSATWSTRVADLANTILGGRAGVLRVQVGDGSGPPAIVQALVAVEAGPSRWEWLTAHLPAALAAADRVAATSPGPPPPAKALLFVASQAGVEALCASLNASPHLRAALGVPPSARLARALHGGLGQADRTAALAAFTSGSVPLLVATDVAARGLDVEGITLVLCYDGARSAETHTHRIGRTGRAGRPGLAVSLLGTAEAHLLPSLPQGGGEAEGGTPLAPSEWPATRHYVDPRLGWAGGGGRRGRGEAVQPTFLRPPPRAGPGRPVLAGFVAATTGELSGGEEGGEPALKRSRGDGSRPGVRRHLGTKD
jgi:superfamily II DNA/RNA helicase